MAAGLSEENFTNAHSSSEASTLKAPQKNNVTRDRVTEAWSAVEACVSDLELFAETGMNLAEVFEPTSTNPATWGDMLREDVAELRVAIAKVRALLARLT